MPFLLRLSNDTEENPGHVKHDESTFGHNAGKQFVAMVLTSLVSSEIENVNLLDRPVMNTILFNGLYDC